MTFHELINKYVSSYNSINDMRELTAKIDCFVEDVREVHPELVTKFLLHVDLLLNPHFTKETAEYATSQMQNKDGSAGTHWDYATTAQILAGLKYNFQTSDWYYVLNMMYSDYYQQGFDDKVYTELAVDFLDDKDAPACNDKKYYLAMHH